MQRNSKEDLAFYLNFVTIPQPLRPNLNLAL